jgi:hypothetical protein
VRFVMAAYMVVAIAGTFTFALADSLPVVNAGKDALTPSRVFASIDYTVDCLAESGGVFSKTGRYSFSPVRNSFLRIGVLPGLQNTKAYVSPVLLRTIEETNHLNKKNSILLKLRI